MSSNMPYWHNCSLARSSSTLLMGLNGSGPTEYDVSSSLSVDASSIFIFLALCSSMESNVHSWTIHVVVHLACKVVETNLVSQGLGEGVWRETKKYTPLWQ